MTPSGSSLSRSSLPHVQSEASSLGTVRSYFRVQHYDCFRWRSASPPQIALRHLEHLRLEAIPDLLGVAGIVEFAEIFRKLPFLLLSNAVVSETADIPANVAGWRHLAALEPYFQGSRSVTANSVL